MMATKGKNQDKWFEVLDAFERECPFCKSEDTERMEGFIYGGKPMQEWVECNECGGRSPVMG